MKTFAVLAVDRARFGRRHRPRRLIGVLCLPSYRQARQEARQAFGPMQVEVRPVSPGELLYLHRGKVSVAKHEDPAS